MYILLAKPIGRCDVMLFECHEWSSLKRKVVDHYGPELEAEFNKGDAWHALSVGYNVLCAGEMFSMRQIPLVGKEGTDFFNSSVTFDVTELGSDE